jgi:hypothetical protein
MGTLTSVDHCYYSTCGACTVAANAHSSDGNSDINREQKRNTVKQAQEECQTQQNTNSRSCINIISSPARPIFRPIPQSSKSMPRPADQGFVTPQQQMISRPNLFQTPNTGNQSAQGTPTTPNATLNKENTTCSNCGQKGHYANRCPSRCKSSIPTPGTPAPPSRIGDSTPTQAQ